MCVVLTREAQLKPVYTSPKSCIYGQLGWIFAVFLEFSNRRIHHYLLCKAHQPRRALHALCLELITYKISNKVILHLIDRLGQLLLLSLFFIRFSAMLFLGTVWPVEECSSRLYIVYNTHSSLYKTSEMAYLFLKGAQVNTHCIYCSPYNRMTMNL